MNDLEQRKAAKAFAANWQGKGYEKGESQPFWLYRTYLSRVKKEAFL